MTQDKALQIYEASFYLDRALVNRALAVLSGNGDATSTVGAMLRDMERMALDLRRLHLETEQVTALRTALRQILDDPEALILNSHRDDAWAALGEG